MHNTEWLKQRLEYLHGLHKPSAQQQLLMALADLPQRSSREQRQLEVLVRAEKAAERAQKARGEANGVLDTESRQSRKKRDHALYRAAGLMGVAGVVDGKTGELHIDAGVLVGALRHLMTLSPEEIAGFKTTGDALIAERTAKTARTSRNGKPG